MDNWLRELRTRNCVPRPKCILRNTLQIECKIVLGPRAILSNCHVDSAAMEIPGECMFHTVPLNGGKYVTVAFGIRDDLKASVSDAGSLRLGGRTVSASGFSDESGTDERSW